jgi:hypothetical protein
MRNLAPPVNGRVGYPGGFTATVIVTVVAVAAHGTEHPYGVLTALAVTVAVVGAVTTLPATVASAAVAWALQAGFVLGRHGELEFTVTSLAAAAVLVAAAVLAYTTALAVRYVRRPTEVDNPVRLGTHRWGLWPS